MMESVEEVIEGVNGALWGAPLPHRGKERLGNQNMANLYEYMCAVTTVEDAPDYVEDMERTVEIGKVPSYLPPGRGQGCDLTQLSWIHRNLVSING